MAAKARAAKGSNQYKTSGTGAAKAPRVSTAAVAGSVAPDPGVPVEVEAFTCESCGAMGLADTLADDGLYECSRCSTVFGGEEGNRCPDCNIFAAKIGESACPDCGTGPVELQTAWGVEDDGRWVIADSAEEVTDSVARQTHERSPEVVAEREANRQKLLDTINAQRDAERQVFTDALPSMRAALIKADASKSELSRLGDPFTIDSTTQEFEHATFVRMVSLAMPDVALAEVDMPVRDTPDDPILAEHYVQMDRMESEYQALIPRIKAAMAAVDAPEREVDFLTSPWMGSSSTVSMGTPTYIRLCRFVGDKT